MKVLLPMLESAPFVEPIPAGKKTRAGIASKKMSKSYSGADSGLKSLTDLIHIQGFSLDYY